jgi:hypothetical protein
MFRFLQLFSISFVSSDTIECLYVSLGSLYRLHTFKGMKCSKQNTSSFFLSFFLSL